MNTKKIIVISCFICLSLAGFSQIKFGLRGGINSSSIRGDEFTGSENRIEYLKENKMGFHFGVISQIQVMNVFIQPELLLTTNSNSVLVENVITGSQEKGTIRFNKLDVPVLAGAKFGPLKVELGPVATVMLNTTSDMLDKYEMQEKIQNATFGFQAGLGFEVSKITIDLKYEGNLSRLGTGVRIGNETFSFDNRMRQWILSVGLYF